MHMFICFFLFNSEFFELLTDNRTTILKIILIYRFSYTLIFQINMRLLWIAISIQLVIADPGKNIYTFADFFTPNNLKIIYRHAYHTSFCLKKCDCKVNNSIDNTA